MNLITIAVLSGMWLISLIVSYQIGGNAVMNRVLKRLDEDGRVIKDK